MKKSIIFILVLVVAVAGFYLYKSNKNDGHNDEKQQAIVLKKHSAEFNQGIDDAVKQYLIVKNDFVDADATSVKTAGEAFLKLVDSLNIEELKKDSANVYFTAKDMLEGIKANTASMLIQPNILEMRKDFSMVSENLYPFLRIINYEGEKLYWQNCPMAFDDKGANWISGTEEIINPYLGKNHPKYKGSMLHCGEIKDTIKAQ